MPIKKPSNKTDFARSVYSVVREIPRGSALSYKEVAEKSGSPRAYRAVASLMKANFDPNIPCHRVIRSDGKVGEYNRGGEKEKRKLLMSEGWTNTDKS
ncbi:MAG: MGMT family protein [Candidatus Paceibacterota bacterium]